MQKKLYVLLMVISLMWGTQASWADVTSENAISDWEQALTEPISVPDILPHIVIQYATSSCDLSLIYPSELILSSENVPPRIITEYATAIHNETIIYPAALISATDNLPDRVVVEYATSIASSELVPFEITYLDVSFPVGGEVLNKGQKYYITWDSANVTGNIQIDLYLDGTNVLQLAAAAPNTGEYEFVIPDYLLGGTSYQIGISAENGQVWNFSATEFTITPFKCTVQSDISDAEMTTGDSITYRICIENPGDTELGSIEIINPIPAGTAFGSATGSFSYLEAEQAVRWNIGVLAPGEVSCVELTVDVTASTGSLVSNSVSVNNGAYTATLAPYLTDITENTILDLGVVSGEIADTIPLAIGLDYLEPQPSGSVFDPNYQTVIISHGWNTEDTLELPQWQLDIALAIRAAMQDQVNVMTWNWQSYAISDHFGVNPFQATLGVPFNKVETSGKRLATEIRKIIPPTYERDIYFIGHSLGTGVIAYASKYLDTANTIYKDNIKRLTLLDSPWYGSYPGGDFFSSDFFTNNSNAPAVDNYYSALGRPYDLSRGSHVLTWGFAFADTNTLLCNTEGPFAGHSFAHQWFLSSISDFGPVPGSDPPQSTLGDTTFPTLSLGEHLEYGYYWNRDSEPYYSHVPGDPFWFLIPERINCLSTALGSFVEGVLVDAGELIQGQYVDAKGYVIEKKDELIEYAEKTKSRVEVLATQAFETAESVDGAVVDVMDHANWLQYNVYGIPYRVLSLLHLSDASVSIGIDIPKEANALRFSFEFPMADKGSALEVYINDLPVSIVQCDDYVQQGWQQSEWIDVSLFAGQRADLILRMSNAGTDTKGVVHLDDIIVAKIIPSIDTDEDTVLDDEDNCPEAPNGNQLDTDSDGIGDVCDICPAAPDPDQIDRDCDCDVDGADLAELTAASDMFSMIDAIAAALGREACP